MYSDIVAATQPYNFAVPWGDADTTGEPLNTNPAVTFIILLGFRV